MQLIHFCDREHLGLLKSDAEQRIDMKPRGLWVSVEGNGDGWSDWCKGENFRTDHLTYAHEITLRDTRVLWIRGALELDDFTARFCAQPPWREAVAGDPYDYVIDWGAVALLHDGIVIAPYVWERRLHRGSFWYYSWDCASGCIWDVSAIKETRLLASADARAEVSS